MYACIDVYMHVCTSVCMYVYIQGRIWSLVGKRILQLRPVSVAKKHRL